MEQFYLRWAALRDDCIASICARSRPHITQRSPLSAQRTANAVPQNWYTISFAQSSINLTGISRMIAFRR